MKKLTYNNSKIYPDNSEIQWKPNEYHEGFVNGKLKFRVFIRDGGGSTYDCHLQMMLPNGDWDLASPIIDESTIWCDLVRNGKRELADKYNHFHSLHACHQIAEDIIYIKNKRS